MTILTTGKALINEKIAEAIIPKDNAFPLVTMNLKLVIREEHISRIGRPKLV